MQSKYTKQSKQRRSRAMDKQSMKRWSREIDKQSKSNDLFNVEHEIMHQSYHMHKHIDDNTRRIERKIEEATGKVIAVVVVCFIFIMLLTI